METILKLSELSPGKSGCVARISGEGGLKKRLLDMGVVPGSEIEVLRIAPLGGPIEVLVRGYNLSLRMEEAAQVYLEVSKK
ncbi:MAG: FeoA family protein [Candidatus Omnitrophota bacterium]